MKTKNIAGLIPKKSSVAGKLPLPSQLEIGEIAVNVNADSPFISTKCNDGSVKKITSDGYVVVDELPASGKTGIIYALQTSMSDPDEGTTTYFYDLYIYEESQWRKIGDTSETLQAGENITITNNKINADQVVSLTQQDYNDLVATSAVSETALYNIVDKPILNTDEYQKKLVAGDFISIDAVHNTIDCTLNPNLYIIVDTLPAEGVENKIYLLKVTNPDTTVSFNQYGYINDEWVNYGQTSNIQPNTAGSGVTIDGNNAINAKLGAGLSFDANSAITPTVGSGLKIENNTVVPNIAAPLTMNASNQLTVASSSTYTSTGSEVFTRAGAYNLFQNWCPIQWIGKIPSDNATVEIENPVFAGVADNTLLLINTHDICRCEITVVTIARGTGYDLKQSVALQPNGHIPFTITRLSNTKIRFKADGVCRTGIYSLPTSTI